MFRYRQQGFMFLIIEFSDGKLKQKGFFHSVGLIRGSVIRGSGIRAWLSLDVRELEARALELGSH
jgi:hypothetical protein